MATPMKKALRASHLTLGVCYYPEHWPESLWEDDYRRMREMGLEIVRLAEFAWSIFEPEEGRFEFGLFDRAIDLAHRHGLQVILGTPTATPPAWLTSKYPEALNATQEGIVYRHGQRRHYNYNAPVYRELSARIADRMAAHYAAHPALIGWQIDNELNCETNAFYSEADHTAFREWLRRRYGTLDALNKAWGAVFWNQTYSDWAQVHLTRPTPSSSPNPHLALDEKRFFSDSAIAFAQLQAEAIRAHDKTHFVTTNGLFGHLDSHRLTDELLDFFAYDSYPAFAALAPGTREDALLDRKWSVNLSAVRDVSPTFMVMEQQSGPGGWVNRLELPTPKPGQIRLWTYQSIAHGADAVLYFRWRTAPFGTEIYWHGINDCHNRPNRRCAEVAQVGREAARLEGLAGSRYVADVALLRDYDNEWDGELDTWHGPYEWQSGDAWSKALQHRHVPFDRVALRPGTTVDELSRYRCLVYPHPAILPDETADLLKAYVAQGGRIVFGCRTGYKDARGHCPMRPFPGPVADLCGIAVEDFTRIGPYQHEPTLDWPDAARRWAPLRTGPFNDVLAPQGAEVLAAYADDAGYYAGKPALTRHRWGAGEAYYYGGVFTAAVAQAMADALGLEAPLQDWLGLPRDVELAIRESASGERFVFLLNYAETWQTVTLHEPRTNRLTGQACEGEFELEPFGVAVFAD